MVTDLPRGHSLIAMTAITNTTLVSVVTQSRILSGMAREDVVPGIFAEVHAVRRSPWVALLFGLAVVAVLLLIGTLLSLADPESDIVAAWPRSRWSFVLFIYVAVIISALKLRGTDESPDTYRANTPLLYIGIAGNAILLAYCSSTIPARCSGWRVCWPSASPSPCGILLRETQPATGCRALRRVCATPKAAR